MVEQVFVGILITDLVLFVILIFLACSTDFLNWRARKDDPEWWAEYSKNEKDFLRLKAKVNSKSAEWGV